MILHHGLMHPSKLGDLNDPLLSSLPYAAQAQEASVLEDGQRVAGSGWGRGGGRVYFVPPALTWAGA